MEIYPKDGHLKLEFERILVLTQNECLGDAGRDALEKVQPSTDIDTIERWLSETEEFLASAQRSDRIPIYQYESIDNDLAYLRKEGYVLDAESIQRIYHLTAIGKGMSDYFSSLQRQKLAPHLYKKFNEGYHLESDVNAQIDQVLDEEGEVKPDASPELLKISKKISSTERQIQAAYGKIIHHFKMKGWLTDSAESTRNGRRVLTVPAEHKRKIEGIIHDESATGKTVFIEPSEIIPSNNEIYNLYTERKKEIYKVLRNLCDALRPYADAFLNLQSVIIEMDMIRAKSRMAHQLNAHKPVLLNKPNLGIKQGYNPVLKLKFQKEDRKVVPFDMELHGNNRLVIVSGPNAGGKSVVLKSVGLLQYMLQCGYLIPVDPNSKMGVFKKLYVDIGDQQSLEDDLSTYSSHLQNLKFFTDKADADTLLLIDEFGTGTDPKIGGAIAESVLRKVNQKKTYGVITTHYSNLKYYAFKNRGLVNASMEFNQEVFSPTYQLKIGKPGSSFAYEIATKIGLSKEILKYARYKTGKNEKAVDELLIKLQSEKKETEEKMEKIMLREDRLNKLIRNYENLHKELEYRRKKLKLIQKESSLHQIGRDNKEIEKVIRELKEADNLQKARKMAEKVKEKRKETVKEITELKEEVYYKNIDEKVVLVTGDFARMRTGDTSGEILKIKKGVAEIQLGLMKVKVPLKELVPAKAPIELRSKSVKTDLTTSREGVRTKLDVRGYTALDTRKVVEEFIDIALMHNVTNLTIVHGRGNGILRKVVHEKLKEYKDVKSLTHPEEEFGGKGITFVRL